MKNGISGEKNVDDFLGYYQFLMLSLELFFTLGQCFFKRHFAIA